MTATEEFRKYEAEANDILNQILSDKKKSLPEDTDHVYTIEASRPPKIRTWTVKGFFLICRHGQIPIRPTISKRADAKKLEAMKKYLEAVKAHANDFRLYVDCKDLDRNAYISFDYDRDFLENRTASFSMEEMQPQIDRLQEEYEAMYAPREGYSPCAYCRKQTPNDKLVKRDIYIYGGVPVTKYFCSAECAINEQMAHEG